MLEQHIHWGDVVVHCCAQLSNSAVHLTCSHEGVCRQPDDVQYFCPCPGKASFYIGSEDEGEAGSEAHKPRQAPEWAEHCCAGEPFGEPLYIHRQSCYLFGRERRVADVPTDHPSCSKQHAVLQYRCVRNRSLPK